MLKLLYFLSFLGVCTLVHYGYVDVPLPAPALDSHLILDIPKAALPHKPQLGKVTPQPLLLNATKLFQGIIHGAETVEALANGSIAMVDRYGDLYLAHPVSNPGAEARPSQYELQTPPVLNLGPGRPLGIKADAQGDLIVCDAVQGLLRVSLSKRSVEVLASHVSASSALDPGTPISFANDLDIAEDGTIFFTTSNEIPVRPSAHVAPGARSFFDIMPGFLLGTMGGHLTGRLLAYFPSSGEVYVLAKGLWYANGVAVAPDGSFVAVAETPRAAIQRFWLKGPKAGQLEPLIEGLPGAPDGLSVSPDGSFLVASPANLADMIPVLRIKLLRAVMAWLPSWLQPPLPLWGAVFKVSPAGELQQVLLDPKGSHVSTTSGVVQQGSRLWLGCLMADYIAYVDLDLDSRATDPAAAVAGSGGHEEL